jgi:O-antigen ligase
MNQTSRSLYLEIALLSIFIISLPSTEALKNISWLLYAITWFANRTASKNWGDSWDRWDTLFIFWLPSGLVVALISNQGLQEWDGATDLLRYIGVGWLIYRAQYSPKVITTLITIIIISTLIALIHGYWNWQIVHHKNALMLKSVGHVNHSAIYLAISAGLSSSVLFAFWKKMGHLTWLLSLVTALALIWATLLTSARGSMVPLLLLFPIAGLLLWKRSKAPFIASFLIITVMGGIAVQQKLPIVNKTISIFTSNGIGARDRTVNTGLLIWRANAIAGVGMENYGVFDRSERLKQLSIEIDGSYDSRKYLPNMGHAHNLYANTLAERGLVGFIPLLAVMLYWAIYIYRFRPTKTTSSITTASWGGSLSAWILSFVGGVFNTTMHHEHAILSILLLTLWLSMLKHDKAKNQSTTNSSSVS